MKAFLLFMFLLPTFLVSHGQVGGSPSGDAANGLADAITQYGETEVANMQQEAAMHGNINGHISEGLGHLNTFFGIYKSAKELYDALQALSQAECIPDLSVGSGNMMPSGCKEGDECYTCYKVAVDELNFVRRILARMSCIYNNTTNFAEKAIAFGDNVSGIHAALGLGWQYHRQGIEESVEHLKGTYQQKYREYMKTLQHALTGIGECEAKFGQRDWYQRYGFIYFEFMQDKYLVN